MFKTTGREMAGAFGTLGAEATAGGIAMSEQIAILGTLQATMSGSEAGTKYKAFLAGIGKAQTRLGLSFTDSTGKMLSMPAILQKIYDKYGMIDTTAKSDALQKAFGTKEASSLIKLLMQDMDGLSGSMRDLSRITGMDKAIQMAEAQIDPWQRTAAAIQAVSIAFGAALLPALTPVLNSITAVGEKLVLWADLFPNITKWLGYATLGIFGVAGAMATLAIFSGVFTVLGAGVAFLLSPITLTILGITALVAIVTYAALTIADNWDFLKAEAGLFIDKIKSTFSFIPNYFKDLKSSLKNIDLFGFLDFGVLDKVAGVLGFADKEKATINDQIKLDEQIKTDLPAGGVLSEFNSGGKTQNVGDIVINTTQKPDGFFIYDELEAAAL